MQRGNAIKNTGWLLLGSIFRMVVQLVVGAISARYLGPTQYGVLNYVSSYITLFSIICELGLTITIVNEIVKSKNNEGVFVGTAIVMRIVTSIVSIIILLFIIRIVDGNDTVIQMVLLIRSAGLLFDSFNTISYWYQSKLQSRYTTFYELIAYIISSLYKIAILALKKNIYWFAAATSIDSALIAIFLIYGFYKHSDTKLSLSKDVCRRLFKLGMPFVFSGIMVYIYGQIDRIMIGKMMSQTAVGYYSCAASIGTMISFIPQAIMNSGKTVIMEQKDKSEKGFELRMRQTLAAVLWLMILYAIFMFFFGKLFIWILFGKDYLPAISTLRVLIWSYGLSYVGTLRNVWLICEDKRNYATVFSTVGAVVNILLNVILIPYIGIIGAAIATVLTQLMTTLIVPFIITDTRCFAVLILEALALQKIELKQIIDEIRLRIHLFFKHKEE